MLRGSSSYNTPSLYYYLKVACENAAHRLQQFGKKCGTVIASVRDKAGESYAKTKVITPRLITAHQWDRSKVIIAITKTKIRCSYSRGEREVGKGPLFMFVRVSAHLQIAKVARGRDMSLSKLSRQQAKPGSSLQDTSDHSGGINLILMPQCLN